MGDHVLVDGERIGFDVFGSGDDCVVLLPATLTARSMQRPLARRLASSGHRVVTLDLISSPDARYASDDLAYRVLGALDELGVEHFVLDGASVGSAVALEVALRAPERVTGLVLEGPFLEDGTAAAAYGWSLLLATFTAGAPLLRPLGAAARRLPRGSVGTDVVLDLVGQDPDAAAAYLRGMFFNRMGPPPVERRTIDTPALILAFPGDPFHPLSDARRLANELPNATLRSGGTILDLRLRPARITTEIERFIGALEPVAA